MTASRTEPSPLLTKKTRWILAVVLLATAVGARLPHLHEHGLDFHPVRQYRAALIASGLVLEDRTGWEAEVGRSYLERNRPLEPTVAEHVASLGWRITGERSFVLPRALSAVYWILGAIALQALARRLVGSDAAFAASGFFLLAPYAVRASTSFQPDPLMIGCVCAALLALERLADRPTGGRFLVAGAACGLALLVKPVAVFPLAFGGLARFLAGRRLLELARDPKSWAFAASALAAPAAWYLWGIFGSGSLERQAGESFQVGLLSTPAFWDGWWRMVAGTAGAASVAVGVAALFLARGVARRWLVGLWSGHVVYGLVFTHHIMTHDYYQLPIFAIAGLSLAAVAGSLLDRVSEARRRAVSIVWPLLLVVAGAAAVFLSPYRDMRRDVDAELAIAREAAAELAHSASVAVLAPDRGKPLQFHGDVGAWAWPESGRIERLKRTGGLDPGTEARLLELTGGTWPDWFCVTQLRELTRQPALKQWLEDTFPVAAEGRGWRIYDLRR